MMIKRNALESGNKIYALFALIFIFNTAMFAQTKTPLENNDYSRMSELDEKPDFPGGIMEFYKYVHDNYQTPKVQGLAGKIYMSFIIQKDGSLADIKVLRDIGYGTGQEAIRVIQNSPKWIPGKRKGETVRVLYTLPITIQSDEKFIEKVYSVGEVFEKPKYPGGLQNFYIDISKHFKTPEKEGLKGKIIIGFVIEKDGSVLETKILKDIGYGTGEEAMRSIKLIKKWIPGKLKDGNAVRTAYSLPISVQEVE
jgi:hypothetical protein